MDEVRWERGQALFEAAVSLPEARRQSFLDEHCADDPELRAQIGRMLASDAAAGSNGGDDWLAAVVSDARAELGESDVVSPGPVRRLGEGAMVGPYRLVEELGRGGMGAVFLGERDDETYQGRVAIKLLRDPFASDEVRQRFLAERQILALLDHPNISRLLDGGSTEDDVPYVIMELVEGEPITEYCDRRRLGTTERLELLLQVCEAVQYAHRNLVIHRDLKPSNILVTEAGVPKLLDFGIAKLLAVEELPFTVAQTRTQARLLTPDYASPEQILGRPVSTASDVYSLGVVLYELLTGRLPRPSGDAATLASQASVEPERPSTAVAERRDEELDDAAARFRARDTEPRQLARLLAGDLDHITLMALRTEPERRYASVDQLAQDLRNHLAGLPVTARPSSASYRTRKFVRRHWRGVTVAALVLALTSGLVGFYTQRLASERSLARAEAAKLRQVSSFLRGLFEISDPDRSKGESITARELLDDGASRIEAELAEQPALQAEMMNLIGEVYLSLALFDEAEPQIERAVELRRALAGDGRSGELAESLASLARLRGQQGEFDLARQLHVAALEMNRELYGERDLRVAGAESELASALSAAGLYEEAEALHRRSLELRLALEDEPGAIAATLDSLAAAVAEQGRYEEAIELYQRSLAGSLEISGEDNLDVAATYSNLANALRMVGADEESARALRASLRIRRRLLGDGHPTVTTSLNTLAVVLYERGDYDGAEPLFREAVRIREETLGVDHPRVAVPVTGLASLLREKGQLDEAEQLFERSLELHRGYPEGDARVAHSLVGMASIRTLRGDHESAERLLREALEIREAALPSTHWRIADTKRQLGESLLAQQRPQEALPLLESAQEGLAASFGPRDERTLEAGALVAEVRSRGDEQPEGGR